MTKTSTSGSKRKKNRPKTKLGIPDLEHSKAAVLRSPRGWERAFGDDQYDHPNEEKAKVDVTPELLRPWFKDAMLQHPVHIADLQRASVVDLLRLLDYPNDYVPVLTRHLPASEYMPVIERVDIMDKRALNARLARSYLVETDGPGPDSVRRITTSVPAREPQTRRAGPCGRLHGRRRNQ
jgi:hypothetical protein